MKLLRTLLLMAMSLILMGVAGCSTGSLMGNYQEGEVEKTHSGSKDVFEMKRGFGKLLAAGHPTSGMETYEEVSPELFTTKDKTECGYEFFMSDDETTSAGVWECAPYVEEFDEYPDNEMITVISGSVTLTSPSGDSETYTSGDTFFIAKGAKIKWEITEKLLKFYMISD